MYMLAYLMLLVVSAVSGDGFIARDMTFRNTAGPRKHQGVAFRSSSDRSVLKDPLSYVPSERHFYRNCDIHGTVDFIVGDAPEVFQKCSIYVRKPMRGASRTR
ncbi:probable pectinesterase/pectinesterase inhibitor 6 [Phoenix dactylifera]|uniref:Probable pectinesterase/pectinesterase inhibitor 6 n=1 Tax=Phoenix dactylifera TaxID=42345 RepID=A0A8B7CQ47_PHODC|nr:probable pectinesterase/pectinesterase inhibitor 6 [Phoenix dactylifera]